MQSSNISSPLPRNPKVKPLFQSRTQWRRLLPSDIAYVTKCRPKMLKTLQISDIHDSEVGSHGIGNLRRAIIHAKNVSSLIVGKDQWVHCHQPINYLKALLSSSCHYKTLMLGFDEKAQAQVLNKKTIQSLTRLRRCKDLSSLEIIFSCDEEIKNRILHRLSSQLRGHKQLKAIHFDISNCMNFRYRRAPWEDDPNAPLLKFKYPRSLSSLKLKLQRTNSIKQKTLSILISNLQRCHQLKSLNINSQISFNLAPLFKALANNLKNLTLLKQISEQNFHSFLDGFSHLKHLTTLEFEILSSLPRNQFKTFVTTLYNHLASFQNFKSLTLGVSSYGNHTPKFEALFPPLKSLTELEQLQIRLPGIADLDYRDLQPLSQALQYFHCLKRLHLSFDSENISPSGICSLARGLQKLHSLHDLTLSASYCRSNFDSKSIKTFFDSIAHLPLKNMSVHLGRLYRDKMKNFWREKPKLTPLFSALYGFNQLTSLCLTLSAFRLSTAEAKHFSLALKELKQLETFLMTLPQFDAANNHEGFARFFASFKEMLKLFKVYLSFIGESMKDEQVKIVTESLRACRSLRSLNLWFCEADELTENSLLYLSIGLQNFLLLKELQLSFTREKSFSNESIGKLLESLTLLKYLESLWVSYPPGSSSPEVVSFAKDLVEQQRFQRLTWFTIGYTSI